jgi:hypothetical protein
MRAVRVAGLIPALGQAGLAVAPLTAGCLGGTVLAVDARRFMTASQAYPGTLAVRC